MRKTINFPPYEEAEVKAILEDGSVLCDLYGGKIEPEEIPSLDSPSESLSEGIGEPEVEVSEQWQWKDTDILFPAGSEIVVLSPDEKLQHEMEQEALLSNF